MEIRKSAVEKERSSAKKRLRDRLQKRSNVTRNSHVSEQGIENDQQEIENDQQKIENDQQEASSDASDSKVLKEMQLKFRKHIANRMRLRKIYEKLCRKFKVGQFTLQVFTIFLKMGTKMSSITPTVTTEVWNAICARTNEREYIGAEVMPLKSLEAWIFDVEE